jgi:hypothetical protein
VDKIIGRLRRRPIYADDITSRPPAEHLPRAETMRAFLDQLNARFGGATGWLARHGNGDDLPRLRAKLL